MSKWAKEKGKEEKDIFQLLGAKQPTYIMVLLHSLVRKNLGERG